MKAIITILVLLLGLNSNAQLQEILVQNDWYLYDLTVDGQVYSPPSNEEVSSVLLNFQEIDTAIEFSTFVCNSASGNVTIDESTESFMFNDELTFTLIECNNSENSTFEGIYFGFYNDTVEYPFDVFIIWIDDPDSNEELIGLEIVSGNGDVATYHNWVLSKDEFPISTFKLYPNPVKDKLFISSVTEKNLSINIYDFTGKLILSEEKTILTQPINIQQLQAGIYLVSIKDIFGNTSVKKMIKK